MCKSGTDQEIDAVGSILNDKGESLSKRFRALFMLRNFACDRSVRWIVKCFGDSSALLKHELAFCLGQAQNQSAIPYLSDVLNDKSQEIIVRHEAAEALGALGGLESLSLLKKFVNDESQVLAETCILATHRIEWMEQRIAGDEDAIVKSPFNSVDPAPASTSDDIGALSSLMTDSAKPFWDRYMAMFALRNLNTDNSIKALAKGLYCDDSALLRHEVAYTLGQSQSPVAVKDLMNRLQFADENPMVRHECAEALGAIATDECQQMLKKCLNDSNQIVRESCEVALDMADYERSGEFDYAVHVVPDQSGDR